MSISISNATEEYEYDAIEFTLSHNADFPVLTLTTGDKTERLLGMYASTPVWTGMASVGSSMFMKMTFQVCTVPVREFWNQYKAVEDSYQIRTFNITYDNNDPDHHQNAERISRILLELEMNKKSKEWGRRMRPYLHQTEALS